MTSNSQQARPIERRRRNRGESNAAVLIVCNDANRRAAITRAMRAAGYAVVQDRLALQAARHLPRTANERNADTAIAAVVVDAGPEQGMATWLLTALREIDSALPIVLVVPSATAAVSGAADRLRVQSVLEVPVAMDDLVACVDAAVVGG